MTEGKQTVAGAYLKIEGHERECALRYAALGKGISDLSTEQASIKSGIRTGLWMLATIGLSVIGWLALQVYDLNRDQAHMNDRPASVSTVATSHEASSVVTTRSVDPQQ